MMDLEKNFIINASCILNASDRANHLNFLSKCLVHLQQPGTWDMPPFCNFTGHF